METTQWQQEREKTKEEALAKHARLHRLFREDRLGFERERRRMIDAFFNEIEDPEKKERLMALQASWDRKMRHAGSSHNRFVLAQTFFWDHFFESWQPALKTFTSLFQDEGKRQGDSGREG